MPLNVEEKHRHEKYKREQKQYARPTKEQLEIAKLEEDLKYTQAVNRHLNNTLDKLVDQRDRINGHIAHYEAHERAAGVTLDAIRAVLR